MSAITFGSFDLPFAVQDDEEEQPSGKSEQLEFLQDKVPAKCVFLGEINSEIDHSPRNDLGHRGLLLPDAMGRSGV